MKEGWEKANLKDMAKIMYGHTAKASGDIEGPKYLRITDIQESRVDWESVPSCPSVNGEINKYKLGYGDIVFARTGATTGKSFLITEAPEAVFASYLIRVQADAKVILPEFLYLFFQTPTYWEVIAGGITGSAQGGFNAQKLGGLEIPIPPLPEQERIVAKLDAAFAAIDKAKANVERNLHNAKELFQSKLNEVFSGEKEGWVEKYLSEVCSITSLLVDPRQSQYENMMHVGGGNIVSEIGELIDLKTAKEEALKSGKFEFDESMVLYNKIRPYLVKVARPDFSGLCSADMYPLKPLQGVIDRDFLYYLLISKPFTDYAVAGSERAGMPKVNRPHLFAFSFWLPPMEFQQNAVIALNRILEISNVLQTQYTRKLTELETLKKSVLERAFRGEI